MTRTFTPHELLTLTSAQVEALPPADRKAFHEQNAKATDPNYPWSPDMLSFRQPLEGDYKRIGSRRVYEWGE